MTKITLIKNTNVNNYFRNTYIIHVSFEEARNRLFDERSNHQGAVTVANGTC